MKLVINYIIGAAVGIALVLGLFRMLPDAFRAEQAVDEASSITPAQNIHDPDVSISLSRRNAITKAVKDVSPAVVGINVIAFREFRRRNPFFDDPFFRGMFPDRVYRQKVENLGSGFIISPDGYILTNEHLVHQATEIIVTMTDGNKYEADIVGYDYESDIALLKIKGSDFTFIPFGDSDGILIGEWAIALGNPFGLFAIHSQPSVTVGVVSALDRDFDRDADARLYQDMVQTDASINRGNSGGPLVNSMGELIGMNTMIFTETGGSIGLGFAIPSNRLQDVFFELKDRGLIDRDFWIGLSIQNVNRLIAMSLHLPEVSGVIVTDVENGSPEQKAGLEATDVIIGLNGRKVRSTRDIRLILRNSDLRVGDRIELMIIRNGKVKKISFELGKKGK